MGCVSSAGGWGKPPVDESGVPVYGDVFDTVGPEVDSDDDVPRTIHWGELEVADEESEAEDDDEDDDDEDGGWWGTEAQSVCVVLETILGSGFGRTQGKAEA